MGAHGRARHGVTPVGDTATLTPISPLALGAVYTVTVAGAVADPAGNDLGADDTWTFTTVPPDLTAPVIYGLEASRWLRAAPRATVQWRTDEPATSVVELRHRRPGALSRPASTAGYVLGQSSVSRACPEHHVLLPGDVGRPLRKRQRPRDPSFLTPAASYTDTTVADFTAGTLDACTAVRQTGDGEVALAGAAGSTEFFTFPSNWTIFPWGGGGSATVLAGQLVVDGARASTQVRSPTAPAPRSSSVPPSPGRRSRTPASRAGTTRPTACSTTSRGRCSARRAAAPRSTRGSWASGGSSVDVDLDPGNTLNLVGTPHTYRIDWTGSGFEFFVDGTSRHTSTPIAEAMRIGASDVTSGDVQLSLDWLRASPYASAGTFVSRVFDGGGATNWGTLSWTADTVGTTLAMSVRAGDTNPPTEGSGRPSRPPARRA